MKILYVCTTTDLGGAERALLQLARAAHDAGHTVKVLCLKPLGVVAEEIKKNKIEICSLDLQGRFGPVQTAGALSRLIAKIQDFSPDIVHAFLYRAIQFARLAKRRLSFTLITTPHYDLSKKNYFLRLCDRALKDADDVSCAESHTTFSFLLENQKYKKEKMRLVCNGVDAAFFAPNPTARQTERTRLGFGPQEVVFCCVARLTALKNQALLLKSFAAVAAKNPFLRLLVVGDGSENANLRRFSQKEGLNKKIIFTGQVSDVRSFLWAADIFVLPSLEESLPLSLLEAGACGLPAIVSKVGDMPIVVKHGQNGFVFNGTDFVLLSALLAELAENSSLRKQMGNKFIEIIKKDYVLPEPFYLNLYQEKFSREN